MLQLGDDLGEKGLEFILVDSWKSFVRSCLCECMIRSEVKCVSVCRLEGKNVHALRGPLVDDGCLERLVKDNVFVCGE